MRIRKPGKIENGLWYLGHEESGVYLLESRDGALLISGGTGYIIPRLLRQIEEFKIEKDKIHKLIILHAHFDHVGIVPFFKKLNPDLQVYASARAWEILNMPKAIATINAFGRSTANRMNMDKAYEVYDLEWKAGLSGEIIGQGDIIRLGNADIHIFETLGHSSCSISAYIPHLKALFPSDGGGIPFKQTIVTLGNSNYTQFQQSLEKLKRLKVNHLCADHYGHICGEEAEQFIPRAIRKAQTFRAKMESIYEKKKDIDLTAKELTHLFYRDHPDYMLPPEITEGIHRQMIRHIAGAMG